MLSTKSQKNPLPSSYFSSSIIQFTSRDQNNLIIMYRQPNVHEQDSPLAAFLKIHSCNLAKFLVSILDPLTRNQLGVKQIMFTSSHCYSLSNSKNPSTYIDIFDITSRLTNRSLDKTLEPIWNKSFINNAT